MKRTLVVLALVVTTLRPAYSDDLKTGLDAFEAGRYADAMQRLSPKTVEGDPLAQYYVGRMFEEGLGVEQDFKSAASSYRGAANGYFRSLEEANGSLSGNRQDIERCRAEVESLHGQIQELRETLDRIRREIDFRR